MQRGLCSCLGRSIRRQAQQSSELLGAQQTRQNATKPAEPAVEKIDEGPGPPVITIQSLRASRGLLAATKAIVPMETADSSSPPSAATSVGAMSFGALGAVAIAAMGVYGVYQLSWWVADKSGRSMDAESSYAPPPMILSPDLLAGKKAAMEAEYANLQQAPPSPQVVSRLRQLREEARTLQ